VIPNLRSVTKAGSGVGGIWRRVARMFYGELNNYLKKTLYVSKVKQNDRENAVNLCLLILNILEQVLRGLSPRANYTDRAAAAGRRS